ncbi:MAG: tetratricopeptide repeat protein, partial [Planctomycetota bacterium]
RSAELASRGPEASGIDDPGELYYVLGVLQQDRGDDDAALIAFREAVLHQPNDVRILKDLATLLAKQGRIELAATELARAVQIAPNDIDAVRKLATLRMAQQRLPEAIDGFENVVREQPGDLASFYNLANAYRATGRIEQALAIYRRLVERAPNMVLAANNLAWIEATHPDEKYRDGDHAVKLARDFCRRTKHQNPSLLDTLAAAFAEQGDFDKAIAAVERAIELQQSDDADAARPLVERKKLYQQRKAYRDVKSFGRRQ